MEEDKILKELEILKELTKYVPRTVAKRVIHLIKLAKKNNINTLFAKIYEDVGYLKEYLVDLDLTTDRSKIAIRITEVLPLKEFSNKEEWIKETLKRRIKITIDKDDITTETTNIETTGQEYTEKELEILNKLLNYIPKEQAERVIYLTRLAKEYYISDLFATVHEDDKQYTRLFLQLNEIEVITGEKPPLEKRQSIKEWANRRKTVTMTI